MRLKVRLTKQKTTLSLTVSIVYTVFHFSGVTDCEFPRFPGIGFNRIQDLWEWLSSLTSKREFWESGDYSPLLLVEYMVYSLCIDWNALNVCTLFKH